MSFGELAQWITAISTVAIAIAAVWQLPLIRKQIRAQREEQKKWATVAACERYDTDPTLHAITQRIWTASSQGRDYTNLDLLRHDVISLLNYLDALAIGVEQRLYIEEIVKDSMQLVIKKAVEQFLLTDPPGKFCETEGYENLIHLYRKWNPVHGTTQYKER